MHTRVVHNNAVCNRVVHNNAVHNRFVHNNAVHNNAVHNSFVHSNQTSIYIKISLMSQCFSIQGHAV